MGHIVKLKCAKCGREENLMIGVGMTFCNLETTVTLFDEETQKKIKDAVNRNKAGKWRISKEIGICRKCHNIFTVPKFTLTGADGEKMECQGMCDCGAKADIVDQEKLLNGTIKLECPSCGDLFVATEDGFWD